MQPRDPCARFDCWSNMKLSTLAPICRDRTASVFLVHIGHSVLVIFRIGWSIGFPWQIMRRGRMTWWACLAGRFRIRCRNYTGLYTGHYVRMTNLQLLSMTNSWFQHVHCNKSIYHGSKNKWHLLKWLASFKMTYTTHGDIDPDWWLIFMYFPRHISEMKCV